MNHNHLVLFQAVAEEGSFGRGARRMNISQPAVSKQVGLLERDLGLTLFDRLPRGVRLTAAGERLLGYVQQLQQLERQAERSLAEMRGLKGGKLAIGASTTIGIYLLPEVFGAFRRQYPGIELRLEIANTRTIQHQFASLDLDLGLTEGTATGRDADHSLIAEVFHEDELVLIAPPDHPLRIARRVNAKQLGRYPMLMREAGSGTRSVIEKALARHHLAIEPTMSMGSTEAIKRGVAAGLGVAIVSRLSVAQELALGRLAIVPIADLKIRRPLHRLHPRTTGDSAVVRAFIEMLDETLHQGAIVRRQPQALTWSI